LPNIGVICVELNHRVHTEWQLLISGEHSIMMEKSTLAAWGVRVGGARPHPFTLVTITYKVAMYAPAERAVHSSYFVSTPVFTL
jgi:hypothetical protein